jgi:FlaA1/EpsC-like NDP-sugar epimerase
LTNRLGVSPATGPIARTVRLLLSFLLDIGIVLGSYALALSLKFDGSVPGESWRQLAWAGPLIAFAYILAYQAFGVYRTAWQYGSVRDAVFLAAAVAVVTTGILGVNVLLPHRPIPLSVNVISAAFIFLFHGTARMVPRLWAGGTTADVDVSQHERVLIVGAGDTGQLLAWELRQNRSQPYRAVCFIDDEPGLKGKRIHGVPVAGNRYEIRAAVERYKIDLVALALPTEPANGLQEVLDLVEVARVPVRLVPGLAEVMSGKARRGEMREITMEDLLARQPVPVDTDSFKAAIRNKVVLVTGAAGSIGSELSRRLLELQPAALHILDFNESGLQAIKTELQAKAGDSSVVKPWLCNILDRQKLQDVFEASHPQVIFHLAAYKVVSMMEDHPDQAFETNVLGTLNVFEAAQEVEAGQVVFLSSHTAVNPSSIYGASKRVGELLVASLAGGRTHFCAIRLTNVIDAAGAVLSIFERRIEQGQPISVRHPEMARYFLTINEVASLTMQVATLCQGGEIFILDVGEEIRIAELAERLVRLRGVMSEIPIQFSEPQPGEKLREDVIGEHERLLPTSHPKFMVAVSELNVSAAEIKAGIRELEVDRRRRTGNLPARLHALARLDRAGAPEAEAGGQKAPLEAER